MLVLEWKESFYRKSELQMFLLISGGHIVACEQAPCLRKGWKKSGGEGRERVIFSPFCQTESLFTGYHIGAPERYINMASPYKALQRCVKRFGNLIFLSASTSRFPIFFFFAWQWKQSIVSCTRLHLERILRFSCLTHSPNFQRAS